MNNVKDIVGKTIIIKEIKGNVYTTSKIEKEFSENFSIYGKIIRIKYSPIEKFVYIMYNTKEEAQAAKESFKDGKFINNKEIFLFKDKLLFSY